MKQENLQMHDRLELPMRRWLPQGPVRGVLLALHGFNDYSKAFDPLARALVGRGYAVYAYDQRGFGDAPYVGHWVGKDALVADLVTAIALLKERHCGLPFHVLGESMGGAVVLAAMASAGGLDVDSATLSAPAVWGRDTQSWCYRFALDCTAQFAPALRISTTAMPVRASDDEAVLQSLRDDPLVQKSSRIDTLAGVVNLMDDALAAAPKIHTRTLLLYGGKDEVIPIYPIEKLWHDMPMDRGHRYLLYPNGWHLLTRCLLAKHVIADIAAWLDGPTAAYSTTPGPKVMQRAA